MNHPIQCRCGTLKGHVIRPGMGVRATCYCRDCQAFARFLGRPDEILDVHGGTPVVATLPSQVRFTEGTQALACMSLSPRGLLRWYASCCRTPVGNTSRDFRLPYVGLVEDCLKGGTPTVDESFGPVRARINAQSATGAVRAEPVANFFVTLGLMKSVIVARLRGRHRQTPFFDPGAGRPVREPQVLGKAERQRLTQAVP